MRITTIILMAAMSGIAALAGNHAPIPAERHVTVCMDNYGITIAPARLLATKMFVDIGVKIDWRLGVDGCPSKAIRISFGSPTGSQPKALAYALPYDGTHIYVFYDRIVNKCNQNLAPYVLGHVLVHEITHILEGICWHSGHGIMKAKWDADDFADMPRQSLKFAEEDIDLIYRGLAARAARPLVAMNSTPAVVAAP